MWLLILLVSLIFTPASRPVEAEVRDAAPAGDDFPIPAFDGLLFYIQRDPNTNTICYQINLDKNGNPVRGTPVKPFWIRYAEDGARAELNYIQRTFAYGIKSKALPDNSYELRAVAYPKHPLTLKRDYNDTFHIYTRIYERESILKRIFIRIDGGTFWSPNVLYIELNGIDVATGKPVTQRIKP